MGTKQDMSSTREQSITRAINMTDKPTPPHWSSDFVHTSGDNFRLIERTYSESWPKGKPSPRCLGVWTIPVPMQTPDGQVFEQPHTFDFKINASSVEDAFMRYESHLRKAVDKEVESIKAEAAKQRQAEASEILVPSGGMKA